VEFAQIEDNLLAAFAEKTIEVFAENADLEKSETAANIN